MKHVFLAGVFAIASGAASAATVTLDFTGVSGGTDVIIGGDFVADDLRIVSGNCDAASGAPCAALNRNETTVISRTGGLGFTLTSYWYQLLGNRAELEVEFLDDMGMTIASDDFDADAGDGNNDGGHVVTGSIATEIFGIRFTNPGDNPGNVRIDDLVVEIEDVAPVPIPAAGLMLLTALGGAAALRRRG